MPIDRSDLTPATIAAIALTTAGSLGVLAGVNDTVQGCGGTRAQVKGAVGLGLIAGGWGLARVIGAEHVNRNFIDYVYEGK